LIIFKTRFNYFLPYLSVVNYIENLDEIVIVAENPAAGLNVSVRNVDHIRDFDNAVTLQLDVNFF